MKKIGIFTLTDALNYGAFYQMYALQQYLKKKYGNEFEIVVYSPKENFKEKLIKYFSFNLKRFVRKTELRYKFNKSMYGINVKSYRGEDLDIAFFGSDEIWNIENKSFPNDPNFFGISVNANKKIAYAPSIGYAKLDLFEFHPELMAGIKGLDAVLFRDEATKKLAEKSENLNISRVIDPTILYDKWDDHKIQLKNKIRGPYIAYYSYISNPVFLDSLLKLSQEKNIPIISAGYNTHSWADENLILSPWEFLSFIQNAECVFTTTFHGTIMSTLMKTPVFFSGSSFKVKDFSNLMSLHKFKIDEKTTSNYITKTLSSFGNNEILERKNELRSSSREILSSLLNKK